MASENETVTLKEFEDERWKAHRYEHEMLAKAIELATRQTDGRTSLIISILSLLVALAGVFWVRK